MIIRLVLQELGERGMATRTSRSLYTLRTIALLSTRLVCFSYSDILTISARNYVVVEKRSQYTIIYNTTFKKTKKVSNLIDQK